MFPRAPDDELEALLAEMFNDDGEAAREHLARGNPIYVVTPDTPKGTVEKRFPDGIRQFVRYDLRGEHVAGDIAQPNT
ncbi:hypothetical protein CS8_075870 [Cupriavidus sp. 8B]